MNNSPIAEAPKPKKTPKVKGPIRTEAIVPFAIVFAGIWLYLSLFLDWHIKKGIEWGATRGNGAEVNVGSVHTSLLGASFEIRELQMTDPLAPEKNRVELGQIEMKLLWDALLRGKFVITLGAIRDIRVGSTRKQPGRVLPPEEREGGPGWKDRLAAAVKEKTEGSALADLSGVMEGFDPKAQLKELGKLESAALIDKLKNDLGPKQAQWSASLTQLPGNDKIAEIQKRLQGVSAGGSPAEIPGKVQQVSSDIKQLSGIADEVKTKATAVTSQVSEFGSAIGSIDDAIKRDQDAIEKKLKLPSLDPKTLAQEIFGAPLKAKMSEAERYVALAKSKIPAKKAKKESLAHKRGEGVDYAFGRPNSYPKFWLRKAEISSQSSGSEFAGDLKGDITDISNAPELVGQPTRLRLTGAFPVQKIQGIVVNGTVDPRGQELEMKLDAHVGSFPVPSRRFSDTDALRFGIGDAVGGTAVDFAMKGEDLRVRIDQSFTGGKYDVKAQSALLGKVMGEVLGRLNRLEVGAEAQGQLGSLDWSISSNLVQALQGGLGAVLKSKITEARAMIRGRIDSEIGPRRAELTSKFGAAKSQVTGQLEEKKKMVDSARAQADKKLEEVKKGVGGGGKGIEGLKKKIGF